MVLKAISNDGSVEWRAMCLLVCTQIGIVLNILGFVSVVLGRRFITAPSPAATMFCIVLAVGVTAYTYYAVRYKNTWRFFEPEFEGYSKLVKRIGGIVMIALPVLLIAGMGWSASILRRLPS